MFFQLEVRTENGWEVMGAGQALSLDTALKDTQVLFNGTQFENVDLRRIKVISQFEAYQLRETLKPNVVACPKCHNPMSAANLNGEKIVVCENCESVYSMTLFRRAA